MEVHHHPDTHHKKKKFGEYFLEFLMIFLAVTLGFIAENVREHFGDREKEKQYISSLVQDLQEDTAIANQLVHQNISRVNGLDSLEELLYNFKINDSAINKCYHYYFSISNSNTLDFNERTISQLINSGNMRLIKSQEVSDSIMQYSIAVNVIKMQKQIYVDYQIKSLDLFNYIFDHSYLTARFNPDTTTQLLTRKVQNVKLLTDDAKQIKRFANAVEMYKESIIGYVYQLRDIKTDAIKLNAFLRNEYSF